MKRLLRHALDAKVVLFYIHQMGGQADEVLGIVGGASGGEAADFLDTALLQRPQYRQENDNGRVIGLS